jgi:PTH1 family peptidyl-tRNA hydrolase
MSTEQADRGEHSAATVCIVGLGNPGGRYAGTRHNVGFDVVDMLAEIFGAPVPQFRRDQYLTEGRRGEVRVLLSKPWTFMNLSGSAVRALMEETGLASFDLLVVVDDTALPLGRLRLRGKGSSGGHNGIRSVIEELGSGDFPRLRCGIGAPDAGEDVAAYVLSRFRDEEQGAKEEMVRRAAEAAILWIEEGLDRAMNVYNTGPATDPGSDIAPDADRPAEQTE